MGASTFQFKSRVVGDTTYVDLSGPIDEMAVFGDVKLSSKMLVNLDDVNFFNSIGTRAWILWLQRFREPTVIMLVRCPVIMVKSFGTVKGILTDRCVVESFYVPFYSEETGERKDVLAVRGTHFIGTNLSIPPVTDDKGNLLEMDVVPEMYFSFLKA
jgi:hypothetical protein